MVDNVSHKTTKKFGAGKLLGAIALLVIILFWGRVPKQQHATENSLPLFESANLPAPDNTSSNSAATPNSAASKPLESRWDYQASSDAMRGTTSAYAMLVADNQIDLPFPYNGGSTAKLILRRDHRGLNVMVEVSKGQMLCNIYDDDTIQVKFGSGPVRRFKCGKPSDGSSDTIFIENERSFLSLLKKSDYLIMEIVFFNAGPKQIRFSPHGLSW